MRGFRYVCHSLKLAVVHPYPSDTIQFAIRHPLIEEARVHQQLIRRHPTNSWDIVRHAVAHQNPIAVRHASNVE